MESTLIQKIQEVGSSFRFTEEDLFNQVAREVAKNARKDGLWTKALSESGMNEERAKALYIKLRVEQLHDEAYQLIEKLKIQEHQELLRLLDEAKEDRKIADIRIYEVLQNHKNHAFGFDVSQYQSIIQWDSISNLEDEFKMSFVFIRATAGIDKKDVRFDENWKNSKKHKFIRGAYHYYRPNENSIKQAFCEFPDYG